MKQNVHNPNRLIPTTEVRSYYGVAHSTLWRWLKKGLIPQPIRIGRRTFWEAGVLEQHVATLRAEADNQ